MYCTCNRGIGYRMKFVATKRICPFCKKPMYPAEWTNHFRVILEGVLESFALEYEQCKNEQARVRCIIKTVKEIAETSNGL